MMGARIDNYRFFSLRARISAALMAGSSLFLGLLSANAQEFSSNPPQVILPREIKESLSRSLNLSKDDPVFRSLVGEGPDVPAPPTTEATRQRMLNDFAAILGTTADAPEMQLFFGITTLPPRKELPVQVITHLTFDGGIPLPAPQSIPQLQLSSQQREQIDQNRTLAQQRQKEAEKQLLASYRTPLKLDRCESDNTTSFTMEYEDDGEVLTDLLILGRPAPLNPESVFGVETRVFQYSTTSGDILSAAIGSANIPCLPFRVRIVGNRRFEHTGTHALKNFDQNPGGRGKFADGFAERVREFL